MIPFDDFLEWTQKTFGVSNVKVRLTKHGKEICAHSPWSEKKLGKIDTKHKLWMNCNGGKKQVEHGTYRCWLTDESGTLVGLMAKYEGISYDEAELRLCGTSSLRELEQKVMDFFNYKDKEITFISENEDLESNDSSQIDLPDHSFLIDALSHGNRYKIKATNYLNKRNIPTRNLYICTNGEYKDRVIIPYYDEEGELIWFNARTILEDSKVLRYMKPKEGNQEQVLYVPQWPAYKSTLFIMEGEFDAMALHLCGLYSCAIGGKSLSEHQFNMLLNYKVVLAFDSDNAGLDATLKIADQFFDHGINELYYVRPPLKFKDWNGLFKEKDAQVVKSYIEHHLKPLTLTTRDQLRFASL